MMTILTRQRARPSDKLHDIPLMKTQRTMMPGGIEGDRDAVTRSHIPARLPRYCFPEKNPICLRVTKRQGRTV